jgi:virulence-associated protein VapD
VKQAYNDLTSIQANIEYATQQSSLYISHQGVAEKGERSPCATGMALRRASWSGFSSLH